MSERGLVERIKTLKREVELVQELIAILEARRQSWPQFVERPARVPEPFESIDDTFPT